MAITNFQRYSHPVRISGSTAHGVVYRISEGAVAKVSHKPDCALDVAEYEFEMARAAMRRGISVAKPLEVGQIAIGINEKCLAYIMEFIDGTGYFDLPPIDNYRRFVANQYHEEMNKARMAGFDFGYEKDSNYTNFLVDKENKVKLIDFITWTHPKVSRPSTLGELF